MTQSSAGILILDRNLSVRSWDPWLARATGMGAPAVEGRPLAEVFPEVAERGLLRHLKRAVSEGVVELLAPALHHYLIRCQPSTPSEHFDAMQQRVTIAPLTDGETVVGVIVTIQDVTARLESQRFGGGDGSEQAETNTAPAVPTGRVVDAFADALDDTNWQVRRAAAGGLAQTGGAEVIARLLQVLRREYHSLNVLNSALQALALVDTADITPLGLLLEAEDPEVRTYAALALGSLHSPAACRDAAALLLRALKDPDANVQYHAIEGLGKLRALEAVEPLLEIAESGDFFLAFPAIDALARIGDTGAAARLVPLLKQDLLRAPVVEALGQLGDAEIVRPLLQLLGSPSCPTGSVAQALASLYDRYEICYGEGSHIADQVRANITPDGTRCLLAGLDRAQPEEVRPLTTVLGWLEGPDVDRALAHLLGRPDVRREVQEALVRHGARVTEVLIGQLRAEDRETRQAAVIALGKIGDGRAAPALTELLTTDPDLMVVTAGALARIGDRRPFEALLDLLGHPDAAVRLAVVSALNSLGHPDLPARIAPLLRAVDPHLRESAIKVAGYFGYPECADALLDACHDVDENVRRTAVEHMPYLEDPRSLPALLIALQRDTPRVRAAAARALTQVPIAAAGPSLLAALDDPDPWVRYAAARALGQQNTAAIPGASEALAQLAAGDPAAHVRVAAIEALGLTGGAAAVKILAPLAETAEPDVARAALRALGQIPSPNAVPTLLAALRAPQSNRRAEAARALGRRRQEGSTIVESLQWTAGADSDPDVVQAAIGALAGLGTAEATAALIALTADRGRRAASVAALAGLGAAWAEDVATGLNARQPAVRRAVIEALAQMKNPRASELLATALDHTDPEVRAAACSALGRLGSRYAERKLSALASSDPDPIVRQAAENALRRW